MDNEPREESQPDPYEPLIKEVNERLKKEASTRDHVEEVAHDKILVEETFGVYALEEKGKIIDPKKIKEIADLIRDGWEHGMSAEHIDPEQLDPVYEWKLVNDGHQTIAFRREKKEEK